MHFLVQTVALNLVYCTTYLDICYFYKQCIAALFYCSATSYEKIKSVENTSLRVVHINLLFILQVPAGIPLIHNRIRCHLMSLSVKLTCNAYLYIIYTPKTDSQGRTVPISKNIYDRVHKDVVQTPTTTWGFCVNVSTKTRYRPSQLLCLDWQTLRTLVFVLEQNYQDQ